jgi:DNA phosphorothioation-dependent restriction protein DptG
MEWYEIVEGEHELWQGVSDPYKDTIRAFLVHFHTQVSFLKNGLSEQYCSKAGARSTWFQSV